MTHIYETVVERVVPGYDVEFGGMEVVVSGCLGGVEACEEDFHLRLPALVARLDSEYLRKYLGEREREEDRGRLGLLGLICEFGVLHGT